MKIKKNAAMLMPCAPDVCQECATDHPHENPHNQQSLHYQYSFYATHGRWPTWTDAMQHCTDEMKAAWREQLVALMKEKGMKIPEDLMEQKPTGR
jgi:hypothetical protein